MQTDSGMNGQEKEPALNELETELLAAGWVKSPNNIYEAYGSIWYVAGPNVKCPPYPQQTLVQSDRIRVFTTKLFGEPYTRRSFIDTITVAVFDNTKDFLTWVDEVGEYKPPGGANVWD